MRMRFLDDVWRFSMAYAVVSIFGFKRLAR